MDNNKNDLVSLIMMNPEASVNDLLASGVNASNTSVRSEQDYISNPVVQNAQQFKDQNGQFSPAKFHQFYQGTISSYNALAQESPKASKWDIFADPTKRDWNPSYEVKQIDNPDRVTNSMIEVGKQGPRTKSRAELAQTQKVWDPETRTYQDAPNDNFFSNLFNTRVMAQWDFDADEKGNKTTDPNKIVHHKGELKLNNNGTYYYENANGENINGKQVLHISDVLTNDDSFANKFDFIDSDGVDKSPVSSLVKNAALIGSMYISQVGPVVAGISVAQQGLKLFSTLGKMMVSSDNKMMNRLNNFAETTDFFHTQSEYANEHPWCWENMINMSGDTMGQIKQQRFIYEYAPAVFKGLKGTSQKRFGKWQKSLEDQLNLGNKVIQDEAMAKLKTQNLRNFTGGLETTVSNLQNESLILNNQAIANQMVDNYMKDYYNIGGIISKAYMTGITVNDMFQEAKDAGASDKLATSMTLGYAAAEAALLNTSIGEWVLPELRAQKNAAKNIVKSMAKSTIPALNKEAEQATTTEAKQTLMKKMFNFGKDIFTGSRNIVKDSEGGIYKKTASSVLANALGEGFEEVTEEVLADFVRGTHDLVNWLSDGKHKNMINMDGWQTRYAMNFLGGFIGGGTHSTLQDYSAFKTYSNISSQEAIKHVTQMIRNGQVNELYDALDKVDFGNKNLSTQLVQDENGIYGYAQGSKDDNQNLTIKKAVRNQIKLIEDTLNSSGGNISNRSLLQKATLDQLRYSALMNTKTAGKYIETFNLENQKLVNIAQQIQDYKNSAPDAVKKESNKNNEDYKEGLDALLKQYKEQQKVVKDLADGKNAASFMIPALLETNPDILKEFNDGVTFETFVTAQTNGKKTINTLTDQEKADLMSRYKTYLETEAADDVQLASSQYLALTRKVSGNWQKLLKQYKDANNKIQQIVGSLYSNEQFLKALKLDIIDGHTDITGATQITNPQLKETTKYLLDLLPKEKLDSFVKYLEEQQASYDKQRQDIIDKPITESYTKVDQVNELKRLNDLSDVTLEYKNTALLYNILNPVIEEALNKGFADEASKEHLVNLLELLHNKLGDIHKVILEEYDGGASDNTVMLLNDLGIPHNQMTDLSESEPKLYQLVAALGNRIDDVKNLKTTPLEDLLNTFILDSTGQDIKVQDLLYGKNGLTKVLDSFKANLHGFSIADDEQIYQLRQAIKATQIMHALLLGMRSDNIGHTIETDYDNPDYIQNLDYFGVNATLNQIHKDSPKIEGDSWEDLPTIEGSQAENLLKELDLINKRLHFFLDLHEHNKGSKLIMQPRIAIQATFNIYRKLQKLIVNALPDDTWDKSSLNQLQQLDSFKNVPLELAEGESDDLNISLAQVYKDRIAMDNAIYQFYLDNIVSGKHQISELIDLSSWDLHSQNESKLNPDNTATIADEDFLYYLATRSALKASDFYSAYKNTLNDDIAPIFSQEMGIYMGTASVINGNVITNFTSALRTKLLEDFKSKTFEDRVSLLMSKYNLPKYLSNILSTKAGEKYIQEFIGPKFTNTIFIEGKAGTGKTAAIIKTISTILKNNELVSEVWTVNNTHANADALAKRLDVESIKTFDAKELLQYISDYQYPERIDDILQYERGKNYTFTKDGRLKPIYKLKAVDNVPKVIFIDEVSRFTDSELAIVDAFARQQGIQVITSGDFNQISASGKCELDITGVVDELKTIDKKVAKVVEDNAKNNIYDQLNFQLQRNNLAHSFRLTNSLRTANTQSTINNNLVETIINRGNGELSLHYYEGVDEKTKQYNLAGTKVINYVNDKLPNMDEVKKSLDQLVSTVKKEKDGSIKEENKIGYIYYSEGTELYKLISSPKYSDYFQLHKGGNSQGLEGDYYVIEMQPNVFGKEYPPRYYPDDFIRALYTGISRARKGSLLFTSDTFESEPGIQVYSKIRNLKMDDTTQEELMPSGDIKNQTSIVKQALNDVSGEPLTITDRAIAKPTKEEATIQTESTTESTTEPSNETEQTEPEEENEETESESEESQTGTVGVKVTTKPIPLTKQLSGLLLTPNYDIEEANNLLIKLLDEQDITTIPEEEIPNYINALQQALMINNDTDIVQLIKDLQKPKPVEESNEEDLEEDLGISTNKAEAEKQLDKSNSDKPIQQDKNIAYSFNSFELGSYKEVGGRLVLINSNENINNARIDSVHGLVNLYRLYGKDPEELLSDPIKVKETLGRLHSIIMYSSSKEDLNKKLKAVFMLQLGLPIELTPINTTFMFKSSVGYGVAQKNPNLARYAKDDVQEVPLYNPINDQNNAKAFRKQLVAKIALGSNGYVFEIPILGFSSPFTKAQLTDSNGNYLYPNTQKLIPKSNDERSFFKAAVEIVSSGSAIKDGNPNLDNLFKLYIISQALVVDVNKPNWVPSRSLHNYGIQFVADTGNMQIDGKMQPTKWISLQELAAQQNLIVTPILIARNNSVTINGGQDTVNISPNGFNNTAGYPFVLVTDNTDLNHKQMYDQFIKQLEDENEPRIVKQVFVLPPEINFEQYLDTLKAFNDYDVKGVRPAGNNYTIYHVWNALIQTDASRIKDIVTNFFDEKVWQHVQETVDKISALDTNYKQGTKILQTTENWGKGSLGKDTTVERNLIYILRYICFTDAYNAESAGSKFIESNVYEIIKGIYSRSGYSIYENVKMDNSNQLGDFNFAATDGYKLNGGNFTVNNKITPSAYTEGEDNFLNEFIDHIVNNEVYIQYGPEQGKTIKDLCDEYLSTGKANFQLLGSNPIENSYYTGKKKFTVGKKTESLKNSSKYTILQSRFGDLLPKVDASKYTDVNALNINEDNAIKQLVTNINQSEDYNQFSFIDSNGNFQLSEPDNLFATQVQVNNDGTATINGTLYEVRIDNTQITLNEINDTQEQANTEFPQIELSDEDVMAITKGIGETKTFGITNRLTRRLSRRADLTELNRVEQEISQTEDINKLRDLAQQKIKALLDAARSTSNKKSLNIDSQDITSSNEQLQEQLRNYYMNDKDTDVEKNRCNSIVINVE